MNPEYAGLVRERVTAAQPVYAPLKPQASDVADTADAANDDANEAASPVQRLI
jgi:site-specific DNA-methyltransferase (adenine-specific)